MSDINNPADRLVLADVFDNAPSANIALGMLRANGIPCILDGELVNEVFGIQLTPNDGVRLMVRERDLAEARRLLAQSDD